MRISPATVWLSVGFVAMWSSGFIGAELGTRAAPATTLLAWRFGLAGVAAAAWLAWRARRIPARDLLIHTTVGLASQVGYVYGVVRAAEVGVSAGTSALITALQPIAAAVAAGVVLGDKTGWRSAVGLVVGVGGTAAVVSADLSAIATTPWWAYAIPVAAMASLVAGTVTERRAHRHRRGLSMADGLAVQLAVSGIAFTVLATATGTLTPPGRADFWLAVAWVIVLSTIGGYGCYWAIVARGGVGHVSALLYLTPAATAVWAWIMFGQAMTPIAIAGMVVCAAAVGLIVTPARQPSVREKEPATAAARPGDPPATEVAHPGDVVAVLAAAGDASASRSTRPPGPAS